MKIEDYIWDVMEIKGALEDDSDLEEMWVLYKLNAYRAVHIQAEYNLTNTVDPAWLQRIHKFSYEKANAADDPNIIHSSVDVGKAIIPSVVSLPDDIGLYRIAGSAAIRQFEPCDFNKLMMTIETDNELHSPRQYGYYSRIGTIVYIYPYVMEGSAMIIASNPLDVQVNDAGTLRDMTFEDEYPLDPVLGQRALLDFLTKDMQIQDGAIFDIINDSQREFKILKDEQGNN